MSVLLEIKNASTARNYSYLLKHNGKSISEIAKALNMNNTKFLEFLSVLLKENKIKDVQFR